MTASRKQRSPCRAVSFDGPNLHLLLITLAAPIVGVLLIAASKAAEIETNDLVENDPLIARTLMSSGNVDLDEGTDEWIFSIIAES